MRTVHRWLLPLSLSLLIASFSNGQKGNVLPTIENDVLRISLSISDASLTVVDKRVALDWRQQVRPGFRVASDSIRVSPTSLSATVLGEGQPMSWQETARFRLAQQSNPFLYAFCLNWQ